MYILSLHLLIHISVYLLPDISYSFSDKMRFSSVSLTVFLCGGAFSELLAPFPRPDSFLLTTSILNHSSYVDSFDDSQWYLENIPFVDFPDSTIQDVYYYRTSVIKRHLKFAHEGHGWVFTEFIHPVSWGRCYLLI